LTTPVDQLARFLGTWELSLAREFLPYDHLLRSKARRPPCAWGGTAAEPYWKELPRWLAEREGNGRNTVSPEFLDTVLWAQSCLFYAVRLQDDLLDGEIPRSPLTVAPLLFLTEAQRAFSSVIGSEAVFWEGYRLAISTTVAGITRAAEMQRIPAARADDLLDAYGCVDAVLSVASSAVCEQLGAVEDIRHVNDFVGELGKVLLALDDAEDIGEDLADGRLNYAARVVLEPEFVGGTDLPSLARTWRLHTRAEGADEFRETLLGCLTRAARAIVPLELPPAVNLIETTKKSVQSTKSVT
jgi:hypothetical protein